jgi:signal transduction histidine kinase
MHHDPAHFDLLLTSIANYLLPIVMWALMGNRRTAGTHCWCLGQWILAGLLLAIGIHDTAGGVESRIGFLVINVAFIFCAQALQIELGKKMDIKIPLFFAIAVYPCFELTRQYGEGALIIAFIQFVYASWLCYLSFLAFSIYKQKNVQSAKWLAYTYIPALLGMLQLSSLEGLHANAFYTLTHEHIVLCGLLLSAVISQFVYLVMFFELHSANAATAKAIPHDLSSGNTPEKNMLLSQIARSDRQKILSELTPYLAHEISQPVSTILLEAQLTERLLLQSTHPDPDIVSAAKRITLSAQVASRILSNIRSFIKPTAATPTQVDLVELIASAYELISAYAKKSDVDFLFSTSPKRIMVLGDSVPLTQVLINLYRNSIDACKTSTSRMVYVSAGIEDQRPCIQISDTGPGFADPSTAGTAYLTTKENGLGLGLAISKSIILEHGGEIQFSNNEEGGAKVTIRFNTQISV